VNPTHLLTNKDSAPAKTCVAGMAELQKQLSAARAQLESLKRDIDALHAKKRDRTLIETIQERRCDEGEGRRSVSQLRCRRVLRGHFGKIYATHWSGDGTHLVSASQDGKLMIWNGLTTNKVQSIPLASSWVITCAYEQIQNRLVACGGMDNLCSLYKVQSSDEDQVIRVALELTGHRGYLSSCCFIDEHAILTASGDATCNLWDIERARPVRIFREHSSDVMSLCVSKADPNIFCTGSCDATAKVPMPCPAPPPPPFPH
jgi:guanine nucleotide-binding protein G(I)/G(S)/G(T) subunit beta-1